ncbi:MAG: hypothetical protein ACRDVG_15235, partial [Jatrophihabitantaceae bacterium]
MQVRRGHLCRTTSGLATATLVAGAVVATAALSTTAPAGAGIRSSSSCHLGNGVQHVVNIVFDNVHFFRDNPNVPSDLEMMPNLLSFFENNGTFLS